MALPNINVQNPNEGETLPNLVLQNPETGEYVNIQMQVSATDEASAAKAEAWAVGERGGVPVSSTDQTYHNNAKYYAQAAEDAAETASAAYGTDLLAPTYSASKTYAIGDHVIYDGGYYACNTAIITAEAWTAAHWTKLTVGGEVTDLKDALDALNTRAIYGIEEFTGGGTTVMNRTANLDHRKAYYVTNVSSTANKNRFVYYDSTNSTWAYIGTIKSTDYPELINESLELLKINLLSLINESGYITYNGGISAISSDPTADTSKIYAASNTGSVSENGRFMWYDGINWTYVQQYKITDLSESKVGTVSSCGVASSFSGDFNDLLTNQISVFTSINGATNAPVTTSPKSGILFVFRGTMTNNVPTVQIFVRSNGEIYQRNNWGAGTWSAWNQFAYIDGLKDDVPVTATGTATEFTGDFDDLTDNEMIGFTKTANATNKPISETTKTGGTLLVFRGRMGYDVTTTQIFIRQSDGSLYSRILWGSGWTEWNKVGTQNLFDNECYYASLSQFPKIGVIGDSYASGWVYPNGTSNPGQNNYPLSWGQNIARRNGVTCINISSGGLTTKTWLEHERGLAYLNSNPAQNLYFICLGLNDQVAINAGTYTLGTSADFANKTDTFYGNYAKIIDAVQTKAPNGKIVLCTVSEGDKTFFKQVSDAIIEIGTLASLPVIDITDDPFILSQFYKTDSMVKSHPTAASYSGYALMIERQFSKCCTKYPNYFKDYYGD